jgi:carbon-monoxide dehydrogenase large subunit
VHTFVVVEIDPVGLVPHVVRYVAIEDCGRMLDRDLVEGQVRGAVAMGIGKVLLEEHTYSENGQLLTSSLRHYLPPLAPDVPAVEMHHLESLSPNTGLGSKGVGEAGTIGAFGAIANAVADAVGALRRNSLSSHTHRSAFSLLPVVTHRHEEAERVSRKEKVNS